MEGTRNETYLQPHRTPLVKMFNSVGSARRRRGWERTYTVQDMLDASRRRAGLSDFGGDEQFLTGLETLMASLQTEARLSPFGAFLVRHAFQHLLANRLRVHDTLTRQPAITNSPIRRPIFIVGLPRTGTTLVYNLLAQDPLVRPLLTWEAFWPTTPSERNNAQRRRIIRRIYWMLKAVYRWAPQLRSIHFMQANAPEECTWLLNSTFASPALCLQGRSTAYWDWLCALTNEQMAHAFRDLYRQLQLLQWQEPERRWVLKSPAMLLGLQAILDVFEDGCVIQTHRDPHKVIASACSMFAYSRGIYSDSIQLHQLGEEIVEMTTTLLTRVQQVRDRHPDRVLDIHFSHLMRDPTATLRMVYDHVGLAFSPQTEENIAQWLNDNPQHKHGKHRYALEQFGLSRGLVDERLHTYRRHFVIQEEAISKD